MRKCKLIEAFPESFMTKNIYKILCNEYYTNTMNKIFLTITNSWKKTLIVILMFAKMFQNKSNLSARNIPENYMN